DGIEKELAAPGNCFAGVRGANERMWIAIVRIGLKSVEADPHGTERAMKWLAWCEVGIRSARAADIDSANAHGGRGGGFGRFVGVGGAGKFFDQVGEVEAIIAVDLRSHINIRGTDFFEHPGFSEK